MPRNLAGPVVRGDDFFGRIREVDALWRLLHGGSVLLAAPRRHGKSSLMSALADHPQPGWTVVLADVEYVETPAELLTELTANLLQDEGTGRWFRSERGLPAQLLDWIRTVVDEVEVGVDLLGEAKIKLRERMRGAATWRDLAELLLGALARVDGHLLIVLDEFPTFVGTMLERDPVQAVQFLRWFRSARHPPSAPNVRFLLGGSVNIEPVLEELGHTSLINDLQRFHLDPLDPSAALELVRSVLSEEGATFDAEVPGVVVSVVGSGVPFFLQVVVSELLGERRTLVAADVERVYRERVLGPTNRARFSHFGTRLRSYGPDEQAARLILGEIARDPRPLGWVQQQLAGLHYAPTRVLARLEGDYYLVRDGDLWRFHSQLLRDWWIRNA